MYNIYLSQIDKHYTALGTLAFTGNPLDVTDYGDESRNEYGGEKQMSDEP